MTKNTEIIFRKLGEYLEKVQPKNDQEYENAVNDFMQKYNNHELDSEPTNTEKAYELLEQIETAKSQKATIQLIKQALELDPDLLDAKILLSELQKDPEERDRILAEGIKCEEKKLRKSGFFEDCAIGDFYLIFETRPYIRALAERADNLVYDGKMTLACDELLNIIKLNNNDILGCRYKLAAIYAFLEDENGLFELLSRFEDDQCFMLYFPLYILYYKTNQTEKAKSTLDKLKSLNKDFPRLMKRKPTEKEVLESIAPYYTKGMASEILYYFNEIDFLLDTVPGFIIFAKRHFASCN